ncbi:ribosome biogenesis GTPase Der [Putridiphycobacter roseus]|uniref:GTPase Der n=1 Tax=Putridiphycobacter roseus TaxID=2219161 RepID=A0A2W1NA08_9FLAO|nr:ribosome biogenesis GTPase Der [Putridiphycobacter roseus]PZE16115.1 ribosome biogenesis GTPase Der [Putridiphycobacter roseus]
MSNIIAIVGRPNVGKSTLFNRLTKSKSAIVEEMSGVTRDRIYGVSEWNGRAFSVIDTGGYVRGSDDIFESEIRKQVEIAIEEANAIIFVSDVTVGITDLDESVAAILRKAKKPVFVVANKVDNATRANDAFEFFNYGLGDVYNLSSINGSGTGELLDDLVKVFKDDVDEEESDVPRISIVGKPNVGKSSFINAITGEQRNIVTDISGTTRDSIDTDFKLFGFDFKLVDTAGIRKKNKVHEDIEYYSVIRSVRSIEYSDVCVLMIDATEGLQKQDLNIFYIIEKNKKGVVLLVNKWDLIEDKSPEYVKEYEDKLREDLAPFNNVPIIFTSTISKQRLHRALEKTMEVYANRMQKIPTSELNNFLQDVIERSPPPSVKGKFIKIKFVTQLPTHSPSFALFCNLPQYIRDDYKRFIENKLRQRFNFEGVPIRIFFRKK